MKKGFNTLAAAITLGGLWGLALFVWTLVAMSNGYGESMLELFVGIYPWYELTTAGAFAGLVCGFLDGFIGTYILVWVYKWLDGLLSK